MEEENVKFCSNCGKKLASSNADVCLNCGKEVNQSVNLSNNNKSSSSLLAISYFSSGML